MIAIGLIGIDRPGLEPVLRARGLVPAGRDEAPAALLATGTVADWHGASAPMMMQVENGEAAAACLDAGAADVVLAADPDALVAARLAALVRRRAHRLRVGDLVIDLAERRAWRGGHALGLLAREYAVLLHLARAAGRTVTRAELRRAVWGVVHDPGTNVIEVHVSRLRTRLHRGFDAPILFTERGIGYRLGAPVAPAGNEI